MLMVHVETDDGAVGTGISRDQERFAVRELINREIRPFLIGKDPIDTEKIWDDAPWELGMSYMSRGGVIGRAIGALDQALWDIKGQYVNLPIYRLLGGASPDSVRAYTTWGFNVYTKEELVESAVKAVQEHGHNPLKYQAVAADRGQNVMVDVERLQAVREAVGDGVELIVDCNGKFDFTHARELLRRIESIGITCVDHPVYIRDIRMMVELRACTSIPLAARAAGENQWSNRDLIASGAVDIMHANVLDGSGYTECVKVAHMAEMHHLPLGTGGGWYLQNGHLIAGVRNGLWTEFHTLRERIYDVVYVNPPVAKNDRLPLPEKPGIGLEINEAAIAEYTEE
jgi:L-alanine-DL-glutamate epimerase-like enolase superfamily enzyme